MEKKEKLTIVLFSGELDRALACFNIVNTAASMGMEVTVFFTFWGLNVVARPGPRFGGGPIKSMLSLMNRGGAANLPLSRLNMGGIGTFLIKRLMKKEKMPTLEELIRLSKSQGVKFIACTTTCSLMGVTKDLLIPEVDSMAGAATFVEEARDSGISLFI